MGWMGWMLLLAVICLIYVVETRRIGLWIAICLKNTCETRQNVMKKLHLSQKHLRNETERDEKLHLSQKHLQNETERDEKLHLSQKRL